MKQATLDKSRRRYWISRCMRIESTLPTTKASRIWETLNLSNDDNRSNDNTFFCGLSAMEVGMGVRDIFKSRQLSSQLNFQKSCQGNCRVNCVTKNFLQGNCQVNFFLQPICQGNCQVNCVTQLFFQGNCQVNYLLKCILCLWTIIVIFRSILVNYG